MTDIKTYNQLVAARPFLIIAGLLIVAGWFSFLGVF